MMTYRELSSDIKNNRGILALLRTRPDRLTEEKKAEEMLFKSKSCDWCNISIPATTPLFANEQGINTTSLSQSNTYVLRDAGWTKTKRF